MDTDTARTPVSKNVGHGHVGDTLMIKKRKNGKNKLKYKEEEGKRPHPKKENITHSKAQ